MNFVLLTSSLVTALFTRLVQSHLLSVPTNTIANIGQRVELECSTNATLPLRWDFAKVKSTQFEDIYKNEVITTKVSSRYRVNASIERPYALMIDSVDLNHAGTYRCSNTPTGQQEDETATAQFIVTDSEPDCGTNASSDGLVEGDYLQMQCALNYSGNWIPVMEWTRSDGRTVDDDILYTHESMKVTSSLIIQLTSSDNGVTFTCRMSLNPNATYNRPAEFGEIKATNIPHYLHSWNYTTILISVCVSTQRVSLNPGFPVLVVGISGIFASIGLVALIKIGVTLAVKSCAKENSVNRRITQEPSVQPQEYEMVGESTVKSGGYGKPYVSQTTSKQESTACEVYASLKRSSFAEPALYAELQQ